MSDIKTFKHLNSQGLAVSTCITYQNHYEILGIKYFDFEEIKAQLDALVNRYHIIACKIGVIKDWQLMLQVVDLVRDSFKDIQIVVDPVLVSSSGFTFSPVPDESLRDKVLDKIDILTPNQSEFDRLGLSSNFNEFQSLIYLKSVKGEAIGVDYLIEKDGNKRTFASTSIGFEKHGSGCVFSAALVVLLSKGIAIKEACAQSKAVVENYLQSDNSLIGHLV